MKTGSRDMTHFQARFQARFGTEARCLAYLAELKWPSGFNCPGCGGTEAWQLKARPRVWECRGCGAQVSVTAGTIFHHSRVPLQKWFIAVYLMGRGKRSASAMMLRNELDVSYQTAWTMAKKLRYGISEDFSRALGSYLGSENAGDLKGAPTPPAPNRAPAIRQVAAAADRGSQRRIICQQSSPSGDARISLIAWGVARHLDRFALPDMRQTSYQPAATGAPPERPLPAPACQSRSPQPMVWNLREVTSLTETVATHPSCLAHYPMDWNLRFNRRRVVGAPEAYLIRHAMRNETVTYRDLIKGGRRAKADNSASSTADALEAPTTEEK